MKYLFIVSMAVFAFAISCAKKDDKQNVGKSQGAAIDCEKAENKTNKTCVDKAAAAAAAAKDKEVSAKDKIDQQELRKASGIAAADANDVMVTIPNLNSEKMSLTLSNKTALIVDMKTGLSDKDPITTKIVCMDLTDPSKLAEVTDANPDDLKAIRSKIYLYNNSSIVADLKVSKGDTTGDSTKLYMFTCNSGATIAVNDYRDPKIVVRSLEKGQNAIEVVAPDSKGEAGIVTSFECNDDDQVLRDRSNIMDMKVLNRIRLRKGSAAMVFRAVGVKVGDKKLGELGTDAQKQQTVSIISCKS